jgi:hypothetical protein
MADGFQDGDILLYPYRWRREADRNRSIDGAKDRPVCMVIRSTDAQGRPVVLLAPISSKPPQPGQSALEIPEIERRRAGLERYPRAWITVDEANADFDLGLSVYLEPQTPLGRFSRPFLRVVAEQMRQNIRIGRLVSRR